MRKKYYKKQVVRNTQKKCVSCSKILTTIDMCYSSNLDYCFACDNKDTLRKNMQELF